MLAVLVYLALFLGIIGLLVALFVTAVARSCQATPPMPPYPGPPPCTPLQARAAARQVSILLGSTPPEAERSILVQMNELIEARTTMSCDELTERWYDLRTQLTGLAGWHYNNPNAG